ncbi:MAG: ABC transporter permease, partial [Pseudomonadota bacterium]
MAQPENFETAASSAASEVAEFEDHRKGLLGQFHHALHVNPALVPLIVLVFAIGLFALLVGERFFSPFALTLILQQVQIVGVLAAAQSLIILTAGIDLSVGAIAVLTSVVMGQMTFRYGVPPVVSIPIGLLAGTLIGTVSGWLVAHVKLPPFIVTLGMWQIVLAANYIYSANETIRSQDIAEQAPMLHAFGTSFKFGGATVTLGVIFMVLLFIA